MRRAPRPALAILLSATLVAGTLDARAQDSVLTEDHRTPRSKSLAIVGGVVGGVVGYAFASTQKPPAYSLAVAGAGIGVLVGWLLGRQYDELHAAQFHGVKPITIQNISAELEGEPTALAVGDSMVVIGGSEGVQVFLSDVTLVPKPLRARGLLGISTVDIAPKTEWLALGAENGLYLYPPVRGRGLLVHEGRIAAVASTSDRVYSANGDWVMISPVLGDSQVALPGLDLGAPVRALAIDARRALVWAATDRQLVAMRINGDSLVRVGDAAIDGGARRVATWGTRLAVAVGERGVRLYDVQDPAHPKPHQPWTVARFAYDVALDSTRMFVAAGPEGVYVAEFHGEHVITMGLARGLGFASAIVTRGGYTYLLDRRTDALRRFPSTF